MNFEITQSLQQKLERRIKRLRNVDGRFLPSALKQFFSFLENEPMLKGILDEIESKISGDDVTEACQQNDITKIKNENELLKFVYPQIKTLSNNLYSSMASQIAEQWGFVSYDRNNINNDAREFLFRELIQPFCDYFLEQLNTQKAMLSLLYRYKQKCEWFQQEQLLKLYENETKKGEKLLALNLYEFLFEQGINFTIEPSSIDGAIDLISAQNSDDPLLADAKVFKGDKTYICKGFGQLFSYTKKYNEPFGYLVIYNVTGKDLSFLFSNSVSNIPVVIYNHKTIFFITIDLYKHSDPPSKRGLVKQIEIKEEDLFEYIESELSA